MHNFFLLCGVWFDLEAVQQYDLFFSVYHFFLHPWDLFPWFFWHKETFFVFELLILRTHLPIEAKKTESSGLFRSELATENSIRGRLEKDLSQAFQKKSACFVGIFCPTNVKKNNTLATCASVVSGCLLIEIFKNSTNRKKKIEDV